MVGRRGAAALLTAMALPVLLVIVGFAGDYGYASYVNQRLGRAADAATLAAVSQAAATAVGGYSNTNALQSYGTAIFNETVKPLGLSGVSFNLSVSQAPSTVVTASGTYRANSPAFFGGLIGLSVIPLSGTIAASAQPPTYVNYYIIVDVSNSMGIGATQSDMQLIWNKTVAMGYTQNGEPGCVFACHNPNLGRQYSTEQLARQVGATLRLDSAVSAIQSIISAASQIAGSTKNISFGIYLLQNNPQSGTSLSVLTEPSSDYAGVSSQVGTIDLGNNSGNNTFGDTEYVSALTTFNADSNFRNNGSGANAASPVNYVFLITDGVEDTLNTGQSCGAGSNCVAAMKTSWCSAVKAKATVGVIYTTYLPIYQNNDPKTGTYEYLYQSYIVPIANNILPNLQSCATSTNWFFQASDGPSITTTMQQLFVKTQPSAARLFQ